MQKVLVTGGSGFIGCNLIQHLLATGYDVKNIDTVRPRNDELVDSWTKCDVLDFGALKSFVDSYAPSHVVHLAARTDLRGSRPEDYLVNTDGLRNIIQSIEGVRSIEKVLFASSRLVCKIGHKPQSEFEYSATTAYGKSKVDGERMVRAMCADARYDWMIFRPTSIWGPWFEEPYRDFFDALSRGAYLHPRGRKVSKSFGYVGNSVFLLEKMLSSNVRLGMRTTYLTDYDNLDVLTWANLIRRKQGKREVKQVPFFVLMALARVGSLMQSLGMKRVPLTVFRLNNLVTDMYFDVGVLREFAEYLPFDMERGVDETLRWYNSEA